MTIFKGLSGVLNLRPEEQKSFRLLFLLSLITGIGLSYYFVAVNTFLIQKASVSNLPYAYIISGLGGVLLIKIYQQRQHKRGIINSYKESVIAFFLIAVCVFFAFINLGDNLSYAVYLAYLGFLFNMPFTIIFALSFSGICSRLYNMSQSKRLLALVGTGEIMASIIGYLTAPLISKLTGSPNYLLLLAAACILPALIPIYWLALTNHEKLSHIMASKTALKKLNLSFFRNERFYLLIAIVSVFSVSAIYFVDYSYLITVRFMSVYSGIEIATILGFFFSIVKVGELVFSFLSGHFLSTKGVKFSILLLPVLLTACFVFALSSSLLFRDEPIYILSFIFLAKFAERVIRKAISTPAIKVLYQVTGPDRLRIEATIEGVLNQVATVISGLLLLLFSGLFVGVEPLLFLTIISSVCLVLFLVWTILSLQLHEKYKKKIWDYLTKVRLDTSIKRKESQEINYQDFSNNLGSLDHKPLSDTLKRALNSIAEFRETGDINQLKTYSPGALSQIESDNKDLFIRKITSSYYSTDNFFHRLLVINFLRAGAQPISTKIVKEIAEISDLNLKYELLSAYNLDPKKLETSDIFYFENLCEKYSNELILAMSAQFDLQGIDDSELQSELKLYTDMLIKILFEVLKVLYDRSAIQVIYEIITNEDNQDMENRLFALELLDNTLNDELKKRLIPIFEPTSFDQKIHGLQKFVPVQSESKEKILKELLMKDFILVNPSLKEACLIAYYKLTNDDSVLKAFVTSKISNLQSKASELLKNDDRSLKVIMISEFKKTYKLSSLQCSYLFNQAVYTASTKTNKSRSVMKVKIDNSYSVKMGPEHESLIVDTYALALFIDKNQSGA
jgi:hypothetical protein